MALFSRDGMVLTCKVTECTYNDGETCHAKDIDVGSPHAMCDEIDCVFNKRLDCNAPGITVERHESHADCTTYRAGGSKPGMMM